MPGRDRPVTATPRILVLPPLPPHPGPLPLGGGEGEPQPVQQLATILPLPRRGGEGRGEGERYLPYLWWCRDAPLLIYCEEKRCASCQLRLYCRAKPAWR